MKTLQTGPMHRIATILALAASSALLALAASPARAANPVTLTTVHDFGNGDASLPRGTAFLLGKLRIM